MPCLTEMFRALSIVLYLMQPWQHCGSCRLDSWYVVMFLWRAAGANRCRWLTWCGLVSKGLTLVAPDWFRHVSFDSVASKMDDDLPRQLVFKRNDDGPCWNNFTVNHPCDASGHDSRRLLFHFVVNCICRNSVNDSLRPPFRFRHWLILLFYNRVRFSDVDDFVDDRLDLQ